MKSTFIMQNQREKAKLNQTRTNWENKFSMWSKPPGKAEQNRCNRAVEAIKDAVRRDYNLENKTVITFPQGSYRNRTNVRQDSDVDVCVLCEDTFFYDLPAGISDEYVGFYPATYKFGSYKNDVERALVNCFGRANVKRGNKAFDVNESSNRIDIDAVPCFTFRQYYHEIGTGKLYYHEGIALIPDNTHHLITNFPIQQFNNGVSKNNATNRRFKKTVRIVKNLRHEMEETGFASSRVMVSFLIESLIWNVPNNLFYTASLSEMIQGVITYLWNCTQTVATCNSWKEVNGIKYLFHDSQSWTCSQVNQFIIDAWNYINPV